MARRPRGKRTVLAAHPRVDPRDLDPVGVRLGQPDAAQVDRPGAGGHRDRLAQLVLVAVVGVLGGALQVAAVESVVGRAEAARAGRGAAALDRRRGRVRSTKLSTSDTGARLAAALAVVRPSREPAGQGERVVPGARPAGPSPLVTVSSALRLAVAAGRGGSRRGQTSSGRPSSSLEPEVVLGRRAVSTPSTTRLTVAGQARMLRASAASCRGSSSVWCCTAAIRNLL